MRQHNLGKMLQILMQGHLLIVILRRRIGNFRTILVKDVFKFACQFSRGWGPGEDDVLLAQVFYRRAKNRVHPQDLDARPYGLEHGGYGLRLDGGIVGNELSRTEATSYCTDYIHRMSDGHIDDHD